MAPSTTPARKFSGLPTSVVGPVDLGRLVRELEAIDNALLQQKLTGQAAKMPQTSRLMDETILLNRLDLLQDTDRAEFGRFLAAIHDKAPVLHISFSADPSPAFVQKLMAWLRTNVHPLVLLTVGLQPTIGAGCIVRTTNKHFDFSLARYFDLKRSLLLDRLRLPESDVAASQQTVAGAVPVVPEVPAA